MGLFGLKPPEMLKIWRLARANSKFQRAKWAEDFKSGRLEVVDAHGQHGAIFLAKIMEVHRHCLFIYTSENFWLDPQNELRWSFYPTQKIKLDHFPKGSGYKFSKKYQATYQGNPSCPPQ